MRRVLGLVLVTLLLTGPLPASGGWSGDDGQPPGGSYGATSFLSPVHLGNYVIGDASGGSFGSNPAQSCWDEFEELLYAGQPDDWEPSDLDIEVAMALLPAECKAAAAVQLTAPEVLVDNCEPGSVFAIRGSRRWWPGSPFDPPGRFVFEGVTGSDVINEVAFNTCLEIFDPDTDVANVEEAVPTPGFGKSPEVVGLTGLDTWLWYDFSDPTSHYLEAETTIDTIRGLPITILARAWVGEVGWDMDGDGSWDVGIDIPEPVWHEPPTHEVYVGAGGADSEEEAGATYVYETKGDYLVAVGVVWHGVYTVTLPDFGGIYRYPAVTRVETFPYQVCELRGVLTRPDENPDLDNCLVP